MSTPTPRRRATRIAAALIALGLVGSLVLQACGSDSSSSSTDTSAPEGTTTTTVARTTSLDGVTVEGEPGAKPTITFEPSYVGDGDAVKVLSTGDGPVVEAGQLVTFDYVTVSGVDGSETDTSYGTDIRPAVVVDSEQVIPVLSQAIVGQPVGSRVLAATDKAGQATGVWTLFVFEIVAASTPLTGPSGEEVTPAAGLPAVTDTDGTPSIAKPEGDAPTSLVVQPLIKGDGPVVESGQTVVVDYVGVLWATGEVFDSSFERGETFTTPIGAGQVIAGWDEGLVGQTVGSRVLLVIPPDKGYGAQGSSDGSISGTDTLVFVVDILAAG